MPGQLRESEWDRVRRALIDLCFERGFRNIELPELLERAEISREDFEGEFADLEGCFLEFWRFELGRFEDRAERARQGLTSWRDRLRATAYALYRYLSEDEKLTRVTVTEMRTAGERVLILFGEAAQELFELIDEGRQELEDPNALTITTAQSVGGSVFNQLYLLASREEPFPDEGELVPQLMYAVVIPYLGPEVAKEELAIPPPNR